MLCRKSISTWSARSMRINPILASNISLLVAGPATVRLSDLDLTQVRQSLGQAQKDKSNEGKPLAVGGKAYECGIGMHSEASFELQVHPGAEKFLAAVGVDDEVGKNGCVEFAVYADRPSPNSNYSSQPAPATAITTKANSLKHNRNFRRGFTPVTDSQQKCSETFQCSKSGRCQWAGL